MSAYRNSEKPPERKESIMDSIKAFLMTVRNVVPIYHQWMVEKILYITLDTPIGAAIVIIGVGFLVAHASMAGTSHQIHDNYVTNQQTCAVHNGWFVPSETLRFDNYRNLVPCRRLTDHSLFFIESTGREMIPSMEYTSSQDGH